LYQTNSLNKYISDIGNINIDLSAKRLVLNTSLQASKIQQLIEQSLNTNAVLLGTGEKSIFILVLEEKKIFIFIFIWFIGKPLGAAVSALYSNMNRPFERRVHGLVRFIETDDEQCIIEGTVDGLLPNSSARINIHEYGDLSNGCDRYYWS